jgi:hypothetical protein
MKAAEITVGQEQKVTRPFRALSVSLSTAVSITRLSY